MLHERSKRNTIVLKYEKKIEISQVKDRNRNNVFDKIQCS